ncbi:unnamed protein product [Moneuplotes crassus]|uniref:Uncharacterized protein n=1 Tax=Euplotes crassus TaxID=5936 RepID=A0AAD2DBD2_EUPCR|nr:unnamed protein product [Moneuplotes crassus]
METLSNQQKSNKKKLQIKEESEEVKKECKLWRDHLQFFIQKTRDFTPIKPEKELKPVKTSCPYTISAIKRPKVIFQIERNAR